MATEQAEREARLAVKKGLAILLIVMGVLSALTCLVMVFAWYGLQSLSGASPYLPTAAEQQVIESQVFFDKLKFGGWLLSSAGIVLLGMAAWRRVRKTEKCETLR